MDSLPATNAHVANDVTSESAAAEVGTPENPYLADALGAARCQLSSFAPGESKSVSVARRALVLRRDAHRLHFTGDTGDSGALARSSWHADATLVFGVGEASTSPCLAGSVYLLDNALLLIGSDGSVGSTRLADGEHYVLRAGPDLVVAIERHRPRSHSGAVAPDGFRFVLVNPIGDQPLIITVGGLDAAALTDLVTASETFMRNAVGSQAGWRPIGHGWETLEWNGDPAPVVVPDPAVTTTEPLPAPVSVGEPAARPERLGARASVEDRQQTGSPAQTRLPHRTPTPEQTSAARTVPAATLDFGNDTVSAEPARRRRVVLLLGAALALALAIGFIALATVLRADDSGNETATSDPEPPTNETLAANSSSTIATTTTSIEVTSTTTTAPTTTSTMPAPATVPVAPGAQLATWGFLERVELEKPSGNATCPAAATPTTKGTVVGVAEGLNIRDGADSSFAVLQRIALGYDDVQVFPSVTNLSRRGTRWVMIALPEPPGWRDLATWEAVAAGDLEPGGDLEPFAYGCGWAATQFVRFDQAG